MIRRRQTDVNVISYEIGLDQYGQKRKLGSSSRVVKMYLELFSQKNTNDMRYVDVDMIGLTKDQDITNSDTIEYKDSQYQVLYVIPSSRYNQILLKQIP